MIIIEVNHSGVEPGRLAWGWPSLDKCQDILHAFERNHVDFRIHRIKASKHSEVEAILCHLGFMGMRRIRKSSIYHRKYRATHQIL